MKNSTMFFAVLFAQCTLLTALNSPLLAQWSTNPNVNTAISTAAYHQSSPTIVSDGAGGAIITWMDNRSGNYDIYAQRVDASGVVQWTTDGVAISTAANNQISPTITSDGAGGAIITWFDYRSGTNYDIYAQRVDASGVVQWTTDGVAISTAANNQFSPTITSDGAGGAIITWSDYRSGTNFDIYAQRVDASGIVQWTANGVAISTAASTQFSPTITSDGAGGAIITWHDFRSGTNTDIYAQRVDASGVVQWTTDGVAISTAANNQENPTIVSDGAGGAIITWFDYRSDNYDIYAQRVDASGVVQWTTDGVAISTAANHQISPTITSDGAGGAIITWRDYRSGTNYDIYAQRVDVSGIVQWTANGVAISTAANDQSSPTITSDGSGGAIITWHDNRGGTNSDIYAQRVDASGVVQWTTNGVPISTAANNQENPTIVSDGSGGAIITWQDNRSGTNTDIYAQWVNPTGTNLILSGLILSILDIPSDQGGKVRVKFHRSPLDTSVSSTPITMYGVWRKIPPALLASRQNKGKTLLLDDTLGLLYDFIVSIPAVQSPQYNVVCPTLADSSPSGNNYFTFLITAHTSDPLVFYISPTDSGYSTDNLSPSGPTLLTAQVIAGTSVKLTWDNNKIDPDVGLYEVHRSTTSGFTPNPSTKIGQSTDTMFTDGSPVINQTNYYRIVTVDIHGNPSSPSPEASALAGVQVSREYSVNQRWNLVSVPLIVNDYTKTVLYPTAISNAFAFQGGYTAQSILMKGQGYWLKFAADEIIPMTGLLLTTDSIDVVAGWNLIGSISDPVDVSMITSEPPGLVTSQFYGYQGGYVASTSIEPGKGYWVKVNQSGKLILSSTVVSSSQAIRIVPTDELPPLPPDPETTNLKPETFALEQNYPNPFNPSTVIRYQLPDVGRDAVSTTGQQGVSSYFVTLKVYNVLGEEVATLVNEMQDAGYKSIQFDASKLSSGVYLYRITAGEFTETKRLMLIK